MHTCMHACTHARMHSYMHAHPSIHPSIHPTYIHTYLHTYVQNPMHRCIRACMLASVMTARTHTHTHTGVCVCVCMYVYIYIYIDLHTCICVINPPPALQIALRTQAERCVTPKLSQPYASPKTMFLKKLRLEALRQLAAVSGVCSLSHSHEAFVKAGIEGFRVTMETMPRTEVLMANVVWVVRSRK